MLKKITIGLLVLLLIQVALFVPSVFANESLKSAVSGAGKGFVKTECQTAEELIAEMGIITKVDEEELERKYPTAKVNSNGENGNAVINFSNLEQNAYRLDIFDINNGLVASFVNVNSSEVVINKDMFSAGAYLYKLEGGSKTICGTFMLR